MGRPPVVDLGLWSLFKAIASRDRDRVLRAVDGTPRLATGAIPTGGSRRTSLPYFLDAIQLQVYAGDTALHIAAASYCADIAEELVARGARINAVNRRGAQPIHSAATGNPQSTHWNPDAQVATIMYLIDAGADPNVADKNGASPLHRSARTRCAGAISTLLFRGADYQQRNKRGSTPLDVAVVNSGRGGTGSSEAVDQQMEIIRILTDAGARLSDRFYEKEGEEDDEEPSDAD
ncbi:MAG TPA: ankyrin repeat domain-containing protein [Vicinamibacterales bacterium]|nr:ankyrin repeat domain-containing protein [Vicinamibacterales bacterium]